VKVLRFKLLLILSIVILFVSFVSADWVRVANYTTGAITNNIYICNDTSFCGLNFSALLGLPTTIAGYGITDAYTMAQIDAQQLSQNTTFWAEISNHVNNATLNSYLLISDFDASQLAQNNTIDSKINGSYANATFYPLNSNPAGYLTSATANLTNYYNGSYINATYLLISSYQSHNQDLNTTSNVTFVRINASSGIFTGIWNASAGADELLGFPNTRLGIGGTAGRIGFENKAGAVNTLWQIDNGGDSLRFFNDFFVYARINQSGIYSYGNLYVDNIIYENGQSLNVKYNDSARIDALNSTKIDSTYGNATYYLKSNPNNYVNGSGASNRLAVWNSNISLSNSSIYVSTDRRVGIFDDTPDATLDVNVENASVMGLIVQGFAGQNVSLFDVRSNVPDIYIEVRANGSFYYNNSQVCTADNNICISNLSSYYNITQVDASQTSQNNTINLKLDVTNQNYTTNIVSSVTGTTVQINLSRVGMINLTTSFEVPSGGSDGNNYTSNIVSSFVTSVLQINLSRIGMSNLSSSINLSSLNDTALINAVNTSSNIMSLGFTNTTQSNTNWNDTVLINTKVSIGSDANITLNKSLIRNWDTLCTSEYYLVGINETGSYCMDVDKSVVNDWDTLCTSGYVMVGVNETATYCTDVTVYNDSLRIDSLNVSKLTATANTCSAGNYSRFNGTGFECSPDLNTGGGISANSFQCGGTDQMYNVSITSTGVLSGVCSAQGTGGAGDGNNYTTAIGFNSTGNILQLNTAITGRNNLSATFDLSSWNDTGMILSIGNWSADKPSYLLISNQNYTTNLLSSQAGNNYQINLSRNGMSNLSITLDLSSWNYSATIVLLQSNITNVNNSALKNNSNAVFNTLAVTTPPTICSVTDTFVQFWNGSSATCTGISSAYATTSNLSNYALTTAVNNATILRTFTSFTGGDITSGEYNALVIADDSHLHTKATTTISGENVTAGTIAFARLPTLTNQILSNAGNISAGTFGTGSFTFPANLIVTSNLTIDTSTLFVDGTNNRIGLNTTTPDSDVLLDIHGNVKINTGNLNMSNQNITMSATSCFVWSNGFSICQG